MWDRNQILSKSAAQVCTATSCGETRFSGGGSWWITLQAVRLSVFSTSQKEISFFWLILVWPVLVCTDCFPYIVESSRKSNVEMWMFTAFWGNDFPDFPSSSQVSGAEMAPQVWVCVGLVLVKRIFWFAKQAKHTKCVATFPGKEWVPVRKLNLPSGYLT